MNEPTQADERLFAAIRAADPAGVAAALDAGADPNAESRTNPPWFADDVPALLLACWVGCLPCVRCLLDRGAEIRATSTHWATYAFNDDPTPFTGPGALWVAAEQGHLEVLALLLERGAGQPAGSEAPLIGAAKAGQLEATRMLIAHGLEVNAQDGDFHTALQYAVEAGRLDLAELIFEAGGRFGRDQDLDDALARARERGHGAVVAWVEGRRRRDLQHWLISRWELRGLDLDLEPLLLHLLELLHGLRPEPGEVLDTSERRGPEEIRRHRRRRLGPWEESLDVIERLAPAGDPAPAPLSVETKIAVRGGLYLGLESADALAAPSARRYLIELGGDGAELDRVDGLMEKAFDATQRERLGDRSSAF